MQKNDLSGEESNGLRNLADDMNIVIKVLIKVVMKWGNKSGSS